VNGDLESSGWRGEATITPPNSQGVLRAEGMQGWGETHPLADSQGPTMSARAWQARGTLAEIILTSKSMIFPIYLFPSSSREAIHGVPTPTV